MNDNVVSWLRDAMEHLQKATPPLIVNTDVGNKYAVTPDGTPHLIPDIRTTPMEMKLHSLDALVTLVRTEGVTQTESPLYVSVYRHDRVGVYGRPDTSNNFNRTFFYLAHATDVPGWDAETTLELEKAKVVLQTRFAPNEGTAYLLRILSSVTSKAETTIDDNGMVTSIVTKNGVALVNAENVQPVNALRPYRTFQEVEQPESLFLTRIRAPKGGTPTVTLIEADGGMWKLTARRTVKAYLEDALREEINQKRVYVTL